MDGLPTFRLTYTSLATTYLAYLLHRRRHHHRHHSSIIVIVAVHLLFKWNIYLSLYVIGFLLSKIDFLFLSSKYAVEACDIVPYHGGGRRK
jgi:hypothetical protein